MRFRFDKRFNGSVEIYIGKKEIGYICSWFEKFYIANSYSRVKGRLPLDYARGILLKPSVKILQVITSVVLI